MGPHPRMSETAAPPPSKLAQLVNSEECTVAAVQELLSAGEDPNGKDSEGWFFNTALIWAAVHDKVEVAKLLLDFKNIDANVILCDVDAKNASGNTALTMAAGGNTAAGNEKSAEMVQLLLNAAADVNLRNNRGGTALTAAAFVGNAKVVKCLLEAENIDLNAKENDDVNGPMLSRFPHYAKWVNYGGKNAYWTAKAAGKQE